MKGNKAKIVSTVQQKGGVGKTSTIQNLGAELFKEGKRVLYIDLDEQCNLSFTLKGSGEYLSIYDVLRGEDINKAIQEIEQGDLIRGDVRLKTLQNISGNTLKDALSKIRKDYDYILLDTAPGVSDLTVNALICTDEVIIPCNAEVFSYQGLITEGDLIKEIRSNYNKNIHVNGVLITKYDRRVIMNRQFRELIEKQAERMGTKVYKTVIRQNSAISKAQVFQENIFEYDSKSNGAEDYREFIKEFKENEQ